MKNEEKRFKIEKIESYEEQISKEKKDAKVYTFAIGFTAIATIHMFCEAANPDLNSSLENLCYLASFGGACISSYNLKCMIESLLKKTMLEGKIEDIKIELGLNEIEESKGMSK